VRACMKHEIRAMRASGGGAIVNMSSVTNDLTAVPLNGLYAATKGGVDALTKTAAIEVAKEGISINALAFLAADVDNGMFQRFLASTGLPQEQVLSAIPIGRLLSAAELCAAVRYLSSDEARFAVGTTLILDGGFTAMWGQRFHRSRRAVNRPPAADHSPMVRPEPASPGTGRLVNCVDAAKPVADPDAGEPTGGQVVPGAMRVRSPYVTVVGRRRECQGRVTR
jgi:enoyl-ACP reductase-like protein